jgi:hypothetical protein
MAGKPKKKLSAKDLAALNKSGNISLRYLPGGGSAELRVSRAGASRAKGW